MELTWCTSNPKVDKKKGALIFSQKKLFLYFGKWNPLKNLFFRRELSEPKTFETLTQKKFLIFREMELSRHKIRNFLIF